MHNRKQDVSIEKKSSEKDLFEHMRETSLKLPSQQKNVCDYILAHYQQAAFMKAEEVALATKTSNATVIRTAGSLGFKSYTEMKEEIKHVLTSTTPPPLDRLRKNIAGDSGLNVLDHVIKENIQSLQTLYSQHLAESFPRAIQILKNASRIYILGLRSTRGLAVYLHALLHQLFKDIYLADGSGSDNLFDELYDMTEDDVFIALMAGSPHYTKRTINAVKYVRSRSIPVILITNNLSNVAAPLASAVLLAPQNTNHYSTVTLLTIIDALVFQLGQLKADDARPKLEQLGGLLVKNDISV
ncbi:MAG: MurR/RpiR family transcriptional regulator [Aminobacterium colombiense]|nr:MurR/RpiR family transcriptional regulator [Aminobacterium colombiense]